MNTVTKTIAPLHFDALEPKRFEDLIRSLAYDFRPWRRLEPTGAGGADGGYDARGYEIVRAVVEDAQDDTDRSEDIETDRVWAIQCKREASLGPSKLRKYAAELPVEAYGIIFAAPAEFTKKARDEFLGECRRRGYQEIYLWGRRDIEDMLFQPKNDHLLFAFFGISLQMRKRSVSSAIRSRLTTRRQIVRAIEGRQYVLLRDAYEDTYPYTQDRKSWPWKPFMLKGCFHDGFRVVISRRFAFLDDDNVHWDAANTHDDARVPPHEDPWLSSSDNGRDWERGRIYDLWSNLPQRNRAWLEISRTIPYEAVVAVDADGDEIFQHPHIYTSNWNEDKPPFMPGSYVSLRTIDQFSPREIEPRLGDKSPTFPVHSLTADEIKAIQNGRARPEFKDE